MTGIEPTGEAWVDLPPEVEEPFEVYVNGVRQERGDDYELIGRALVFSRSLSHEISVTGTPAETARRLQAVSATVDETRYADATGA